MTIGPRRHLPRKCIILGGYSKRSGTESKYSNPAGGTQFRRGDRGLCAEAVHVLVRDEAGMAAARRVRGGAALEVIGCPGHHAILAVKGTLGPHEDEADVLQVLIVARGLAGGDLT